MKPARSHAGASLALAALLLAVPASAQYFNFVKYQGASAWGDPNNNSFHHAMDFGNGRTVDPNALNGPGAPEYYAYHLTYRYTTTYEKQMYAMFGFTFWRPSAPVGWSRLGDVVVSGSDPSTVPVMIVKDDPTSLAKPIDWEVVWADDWNNFDTAQVRIWRPIPPAGYVAMGYAFTNVAGYKPDSDLYRCVKADCVVEGEYDPIGSSFSNVPHYYHQFMRIVYHGDKPVVPTNTMVHTWWNDNNLDPQHWQGPGSPSSLVPPRAPWTHFHIPYLILGLPSAQIHDDIRNGLLNEYYSRLGGSGADLVNKINRDAALNSTFGAFGQKLNAALATANAARDAAATSIAQLKPHTDPGVVQPAIFPHTASYVAPQATQGLPAIDRNWGNGPWFQSGGFGTHALRDVPGLQNLPMFASAQLSNATVRQGKIAPGGREPNQPYLVATGNVTLNLPQLGNVTGKAVVLSRLYTQTGVRTGVLVFVPRDQVAHAAGLDDAALERLGLPNTVAVAFGTAPHDWLPAEFPEEVRGDLQQVLPPGRELRIRKDVTLLFKASLNGAVPLDRLVDSAPSEIAFTAILPGPTNPKLKVISEPIGEFRMGVIPSALQLDRPVLEFSPGTELGVFSRLHLDMNGVLKADIPLQFSVSTFNGSITVAGVIPGTWSNPLDIPTLSLGNLTLSGTFGGMTPTLGLGGDGSFLGKSMHLAGDFTFAPSFSLAAFSAKNLNVTLGDIITAQQHFAHAVCNVAGDGPSINVPDRMIEVRNASVTVASLPDPAQHIEQGTTVTGDLYVAAARVASVDVHATPNNGVRIVADTVPLNLGPISLTGSHGAGGPRLDLLYWPLTQPPYNLQQHCFFSGRATVAGAPLDALVQFYRENMDLTLEGKLGGVFDATVTGTGYGVVDDLRKVNDMNLHAQLSGNFLDALESHVLGRAGNNDAVKTAVRLVGGTILRIKSVSFDTPYSTLTAGGSVTMTVKCSILGQDVTLQPNIPLNSGGYDALGNALVTAVEDQAKNFSGVWDAAVKVMVQAAEEAAQQTQYAYEETAKAVATAITTADDSVKTAAEAAKEAGEKVIDGIVNAFKKLKFW